MNAPLTAPVATAKVEHIPTQLTLLTKENKEVAIHMMRVFSSVYVLAMKCHAAHWNITGAQFFELHDFFGKLYEGNYEAADDLAERIRALKVLVPTGVAAYTENSVLSFDTSVEGGANDIVQQILVDHEALAADMRRTIPLLQKLGDEGSADLLIERLRQGEKDAWMLRSFLES